MFVYIFSAKKVYVGGLLVYSTGMFLMAVTKHPVGVITFSWTAGVMYSTLFTMPYLILAHYHSTGTVRYLSYVDGMTEKFNTLERNCPCKKLLQQCLIFMNKLKTHLLCYRIFSRSRANLILLSLDPLTNIFTRFFDLLTLPATFKFNQNTTYP